MRWLVGQLVMLSILVQASDDHRMCFYLLICVVLYNCELVIIVVNFVDCVGTVHKSFVPC